MIPLRAGLERLGQRRTSEQRGGVVVRTLQQFIELSLDGRADQKGMPRMVDTQMDIQPLGRTLGEDGLGQFDQGFDVGQP
nr:MULTISPECIES: hypothetical protein [Pseudomonas]